MRIGLTADIHAGYHSGTRVNSQGVNVREQDIYDAAATGIANLISARVDVIVDLGDLAHVPSPRKRALLFLIDVIRDASIPFYSANGNHTLSRTSSDIPLYALLEKECRNFKGFLEPTSDPDVHGLFIPYAASNESRRAIENLSGEVEFIAGHIACDDVPFPGDHLSVRDLPEDIPTFLGHYHTRKVKETMNPVYIGATERLSWGEWQNPTGVAVYDTTSRELQFIEHQTRPWYDIYATPDTYLEVHDGIENAIVRLNVDASPEEYSALDLVAARKALAGALSFQIRRIRPHGKEDYSVSPGASTGSLPLLEAWRNHLESAKLPRSAVKAEVQRIGETCLQQAMPS